MEQKVSVAYHQKTYHQTKIKPCISMEDTLKYTPIQKYMMHRHLENCVEHLQNYLVGIGLSGGHCNSTDYKEICTKRQIVDELVVNFKGCMGDLP